MSVDNTQFGFKWGFVEVERVASNNGTDKRKKFCVLKIKHTNGEEIEILATKEGIEVKSLLKKGDYNV